MCVTSGTGANPGSGKALCPMRLKLRFNTLSEVSALSFCTLSGVNSMRFPLRLSFVSPVRSNAAAGRVRKRLLAIESQRSPVKRLKNSFEPLNSRMPSMDNAPT